MKFLPLSLDMTTPRFTQPRVIELAEVSAANLQSWVKRGVIELATPNPGRGRERLYSLRDVIKLRIMAHLGAMRLRVDASAGFAEAMCALMDERQANGSCFDWNEFFAINGEVFDADADLPSDRNDSQLFWERWGELGSISEIFAELHRDRAFYARGRRSDTESHEIRITADHGELDAPMTDEEYQRLAFDGVSPEPPIVLVPIGYLINAIAVVDAYEADR